MYLPWSLSLPPALVQANPWNPTWRKAERWQTLPLFAATWFAAGFGIFALSSTQVRALHLYLPHCHLMLLCMCVHSNLCTCWNLKLPSYYLPVAPAVAMLAAAHLSKKVGEQRVGVFTALTPAFLYLSLAVLSWFIPLLLQSSGDLTVVLRQTVIFSPKFLSVLPNIVLRECNIFYSVECSRKSESSWL